MSKFLNKNAKVFLLAYLIIIACIFIFACYFMTQYMHIHIYYKLDGGNVVIEAGSALKEGQTNMALFRFFDYVQYCDLKYVNFGDAVTYESPYQNLINGQIESLKQMMAENGYTSTKLFVRDFKDEIIQTSFTKLTDSEGNSLALTIYNFQMSMNAFNDKLIIFGVVSIILVAIMFVMANQSRRVYYKSNLFIGILSPLAISVYSVILMLENMKLQTVFNKNSQLFKLVSLLQDPTKHMNPDDPTQTISVENIMKDFSYVDRLTKDVNDTTFVVASAFFGLIIVASVLIMVYTVYRYANCSKRRKEIIERAVQNND